MATATTERLTERLSDLWETPHTLRGVLGTVDHKTIGKRYLVTAFLLLIAGGIEALVMRVQLQVPNNHVLSPEGFNQAFTMHGTTMILWYALPILSGFSNYLFPLVLGARDMAFPRLNAFSYWTFLFSAIFLYTGYAVGLGPDAGWFAYAPLTELRYSPGANMDYYALGVIFLTISSTAGAVNFIATMFKMRAPGMSLGRLPLFVYGTVTASFSIIFALPALSVACAFLYLDRHFGTRFFDPGAGGQALLWQHLFWIFGHPWVYIIVLPALSFMSMVIPTFARRPIVGYAWNALAVVITGILGFGVWVHHMFATGIPPLALTFFGAASMAIVLPSAVSIFVWLATLWYGRPVLTTAMLFALGFIILFVIGGVSGVVTAAVPFDWSVTDTYFVVAHIHYVLIGINVFPVIAAFYYWFPKMTGRLLNEALGKWNFWVMFIGFNLGFFPMHISGLLGMPRRIYTYPAGLGWTAPNLITSIGAYLFAVGVLLFLVNVFWSLRRGAIAGNNPWDAASLEWATTSPPPAYNFAVIPTVGSREPLWEERLGLGRLSRIDEGPPLDSDRVTLQTSTLDGFPAAVQRMPEDTVMPFLTGLAILATFYGLVTTAWWLAIAGGVLTLAAIHAWLWPVRTIREV
ncbi:MAG: cytochrome c oxidase subunit I [Gemmatimonadaceae bacterium]|nr:cytochrome c oxidase subunit I [Gemmatimonadaceae bacterium]